MQIIQRNTIPTCKITNIKLGQLFIYTEHGSTVWMKGTGGYTIIIDAVDNRKIGRLDPFNNFSKQYIIVERCGDQSFQIVG